MEDPLAGGKSGRKTGLKLNFAAKDAEETKSNFMKTLRLILGDQLDEKHSWFRKIEPDTVYCMFEMLQETDYVKHHIQKVVGFFLAMREFAETLTSQGHKVIYFRISDRVNEQTLEGNIRKLIKEHNAEKFEYQLPDEFRLDQNIRQICQDLGIPSTCVDTEHFFTTRDELSLFFRGKKTLLMESFYRHMRKKHNVLMNGTEPLGGKWNYDTANRKKWKNETLIPPPVLFEKNVTALLEEIKAAGIETFGKIKEDTFSYPINRNEALRQLDYFCNKLLPHFGDYQDAMDDRQPFLYHSLLSFALNIKLISPSEVIQRAVRAYQQSDSEIEITQIEGFVRQILGWREYMRGVYWKEMPGFALSNTLRNLNTLPDFYWTGNTKMNCLHHAVKSSLDHAYAHHIQRLMILGNFALLTMVSPDEVDSWFLGVYIDAIEWVQLPNTRGMSQWADGGLVATKPYVSAAAYIQKMSNYCDNCRYNPKERTGDRACPFNSLYWNFLDEKKTYFSSNPRMSMMLALLDKMDETNLKEIKKRAQFIMNNPDAW